jgi:cell division protein FtsL
MVTSGLALVLIAVALGVITIKHTSRVLQAKLQTLSQEQDNLINEKNQLLLEQATWSSGVRVEQIASEQLQMIVPNKVEIIKP